MTPRLLGRHGPRNLVAFGTGGERTAADLVADAALIAAELPAPTPGSHVLLVFKSDRYAFATGLLGAWAGGHSVALPPNTRRDSVLAALGLPDVVALLHDTESGKPIRVEPFASARPAGSSSTEATLPERAVVATVFTSGTSSGMAPCPKSAVQLLGEAGMLAEMFGLELGSRLVATVQPSHIYGFLFSVLMPLVSGGAFLRETPFHAEAVAGKVQAHGPHTLVTVPAHLRGLSSVDRDALRSLTRVVCSTAPLRAQTADEFWASHQITVTEILGSSETGGIASRAHPPSGAWRPLPGVQAEVDDDGFLWVESPFAGGTGAIRTADLAEARADGTFEHLGRSDGIVKIGGQRVSLPAMEQWLCQLDGVDDAALVAVQADGARDMQLLAAVVAPGWSVTRLRESLAARFEPSVHPRRILLSQALPREDNGKLQRRSFLQLFGLNEDGMRIRWDVDWGERHESAEAGRVSQRVEIHIPKTYGAFEGHFPGYPILPAAFQLGDLVLPHIRESRPGLGEVQSIRKLKFLGRIVPDDDLELEISWLQGELAVDFSLHRGDKVCSGGRIVFGGSAA